MLRRNLWTNGGLVNGSLGTVRAVIYEPNKKPPELPAYVLVEFDKYNGPYLYEKCFPIVPYMQTWTKDGISFTRLQLPLTLAHAIRIHKAQGLTLLRWLVRTRTVRYAERREL